MRIPQDDTTQFHGHTSEQVGSMSDVVQELCCLAGILLLFFICILVDRMLIRGGYLYQIVKTILDGIGQDFLHALDDCLSIAVLGIASRKNQTAPSIGDSATAVGQNFM